MSGVLHPVGPEPASTYWLRRALVLAALAVVIVVIIALVRWADRPQQAVPAAPAPAPASTSASAGATPTSTAEPSTPTVTPRAPGTGRSGSAQAPLPQKLDPVPCAPAALRLSLKGARALKPKQADTFRVSVVNTSTSSCRVRVSAVNFELRIDSGRDRIWTTDHCPRLVRSTDRVLAGKGAVAWDVRWNGMRSAPDCATRPEIPAAGSYIATGQLAGAVPVRLRLAVRG